MDPLSVIIGIGGIVVAAVGTYYTYLSYKRSKPDPELPSSQLPQRLPKNELELEADIEDAGSIEKIYLLLLIDQFPNGIWGASLEAASELYGHKGDPGSITVSTHSALAITSLTDSRTTEAIQHFRRYLLSRRSEHGAFGMKRLVGTKKYPEIEILEHARHTATALRFFLFYDGVSHPCVTSALRYLLNVRTESGWWVDHGPVSDLRADPITVSVVVGTLYEVAQVLKQLATDQGSGGASIDELEEAMLAGVNYIFNSPYRTSDGYWTYRFSNEEEKEKVFSNAYQYTTDVLVYISKYCIESGNYQEEAKEITARLLGISENYGGYLPASYISNIPNLDTSANLISSALNFSDLASMANHNASYLLKLCESPEVVESGAANGWSSVLLVAPRVAEAAIPSSSSFRQLDQVAKALKISDPDHAELPSLLDEHEKFVRSIMHRRRGVQPA